MIDLGLFALLSSVLAAAICQLNNIAGAILMMILAVALLVLSKRKSGLYINAIGVFGFFWYMAIGLSCLQLHQFQTDWKLEMWISTLCAFPLFSWGYYLYKRFLKKKYPRKSLIISKKTDFVLTKKWFRRYLLGLFFVSTAMFCVEVAIRKEIPLFSKNMSSYMIFGVTGLHYFTVSACLVLPFSIIYVYEYKKRIKKIEYVWLVIINIIAGAIPILIVSRQLLLMMVFLAVVIVLYLWPKLIKRVVVIALVAAIGGWLAISGFRNQNDAYLRRALAIQNDSVLSVGAMQAYMYVACNFDNMNLNVGEVENYTYGKKTLFPIFALTGLKFLLPESEDTKLKRITPEYNTYPMTMTPYQDFGLMGVVIYMLIIGMVCCVIEKLDRKNVFNLVIWSIMIYSLALAFFYDWFASPTIWFYVIGLVICKLIAEYYRRRRDRRNK